MSTVSGEGVTHSEPKGAFRESWNGELWFETALGFRVAAALVGLLLGFEATWIASRPFPPDAGSRAAVVCALLLLGTGSLAFLSMALPFRLCLDMRNRACSLRWGLDPLAREWRGTFADVNYLYLRRRWSGVTYRWEYALALRWKGRALFGSRGFLLDVMEDEKEAKAVMQHLADRMGVLFVGVAAPR